MIINVVLVIVSEFNISMVDQGSGVTLPFAPMFKPLITAKQ